MKFLKNPFLASAILAIFLGATACQTGSSTSSDSGSSSTSNTSAGAPWTIEVTPDDFVGAVGSQSLLTASVKDREGNLVSNARVEWFISQGSVGSFLNMDEHGSSGNHQRVSADYIVTGTNGGDRTISMGHGNQRDFTAKAGTTWAAISSPMEGSTHVVVYCPDIDDWRRQNAATVKHWRDVVIDVSEGSTSRVGTAQNVTIAVKRRSDGAPLAGQEVSVSVVDGSGTLRSGGANAAAAGGGSRTVALKTDARGMATTTLTPTGRNAGASDLEVRVVRPANPECCEPAAVLGMREVAYKWVAPGIDIQKTGPARGIVGENYTYSITVNSGADIDTREVVVTDSLPAGLTYVSSQPAARVSGQLLRWDLGTMAAKSSRKLSVTVKPTRTGKFTNCAEVKGEGGALSDDSCVDTVITAPALALVKTATREVVRCDEIEYTYTVTNKGDAPATNVRLSDTFANGIVGANGATSYNQTIPTLAAGQSQTFRTKVQATKTGTFDSTATASSGGLEADGKAVTTVREPKLTITKTGPERRFVGRPAAYDITVKNTGDAPARDLVVKDTIPTGMTFLRASDGGTAAAGAVTWNLGTLAPNATRKVTVSMNPTAQGSLRNTATASAHCAGDVSASATLSSEGIPAILMEVVDLDDPVEVGSNTTYVITITNQGSAPANNIRIKATLPTQMSYVSGTGATNAQAAGQSVSFAPVTRLAAGAKSTFRLTVKANASGDVRMKISMVSDQSPVPVEETESTYLYE